MKDIQHWWRGPCLAWLWSKLRWSRIFFGFGQSRCLNKVPRQIVGHLWSTVIYYCTAAAKTWIELERQSLSCAPACQTPPPAPAPTHSCQTSAPTPAWQTSCTSNSLFGSKGWESIWMAGFRKAIISGENDCNRSYGFGLVDGWHREYVFLVFGWYQPLQNFQMALLAFIQWVDKTWF